MFQNSDEDILDSPVINEEIVEARLRNLVLYNDDHNTFEFVIESLIQVCNHEPLQAEQCTYIVHYNGKCSVKNGSYLDLNPMRVALCDRGLSAVIE
ncbi:MAG: ATP-dependent Clp protease adaptor ClpS [Bacteroidetes bacterium]|nr:ATP-dependent Clp protease adaptor ClpS [Bacteroidota bacterium]